MSHESAFEAAGHYFTPGTERILQYLKAHGLPQPDGEAIRKALLDHFHERDYYQAHELLTPAPETDWHFIKPGRSPLAPSRGARADSSRRGALAWVLEACDEARVFIDRCETVDDDGFKLYVGKTLIAEIRRISFMPFNLKRRQRIESTLKGIRRYGETERLIERLRSIPGFDAAKFSLDTSGRRRKQLGGEMISATPANWATAMQTIFKELGMPIKRSLAQELAARLFDATSWNHLVASWDNECVRQAPSALFYGDDDPDPHECRFFRSSAEGIYAFADALREWQGPAPHITAFETSSIQSGASHYVEASSVPVAGRAAPTSDGIAIVCSPLDPSEFSGATAYVATADEFLSQLDAGGDPIKVLRWSGNLIEDVITANARRGVSSERTLRVGAWWFSLTENSERSYITVEYIGPAAAESQPFKATIVLYKATLRHDLEKHALEVWADYDRELIVTVPGISAQIADKLADLINAARTPKEPQYWGHGDIRGPQPIPDFSNAG